MAKQKKQPKRRNKTSAIADIVGGVVGPMLRKRGFASTEILENWATIVPAPYNQETIPDKLVWRRGEGATAGTLYVRCTPAQRLGVSYDAAILVGAINRYFGYVLVDAVRLSAEPFMPHSGQTTQDGAQPNAEVRNLIEAQIKNVEDDALKKSLQKLGLGIMGRKKH